MWARHFLNVLYGEDKMGLVKLNTRFLVIRFCFVSRYTILNYWTGSVTHRNSTPLYEIIDQ